jgi:hypothetical protein
LAHQILEQIERHHERLMKHAGAAVAPVPTKM